MDIEEEGLPPGGEPVGDVAWEPWTPEEVAERLSGVDVPWAFAAGWALDLLRGGVSRPHEDVEICIPAARFPEIQAALRPGVFEIVGAGRRWPVTDARALAALHQTWLRDPDGGPYRLDVFREPHDGDTWICRRDPTIRRPYRDVIRVTENGLPYLAPEIVLLFKAKWDRPKDRQDLAAALPLLGARERAWLADAIGRVHAGHPWLAQLA